MSLLRVETRKIPATDTEGVEIAVKFSDGKAGSIPWPPAFDGIDAHTYAVGKLIDRETFDRIESFYKVGETERGYKFTILLREV
jgi:hypothetical protein